MMARNIFIVSSRIFTSVPLICQATQTKYTNGAFIMMHYFKDNLRRASTNANIASDEQYKDTEICSLPDYKSKHCPGAKYITPKLQQLFDLSAVQVKELIKTYAKLKNSSCQALDINYKLCINADIRNEIILQYPLLLTLENLEIKFKYLEDLNVDINLIIPVLFTNIKVLKRIIEEAKLEEHSMPYGNRIIYLSKLLNLPTLEVTEKIIQHDFVFRLPIDRLESILKVLLDYGIEPRNILNDCWALRYTPQIVEDRLQRAIQANVLKVKTWMIRCQTKVFERCINRQVENRKILGNNSSVEEYLSKRLECSLDNAKYLTKKYPAIMKMNISKMKDILDFLYEQEYTPAHVCRVPRILIHSQETSKIRLQQLKELGYVPPSLAILCKSKRDFDKILKKYAKRKKNKDIKEPGDT